MQGKVSYADTDAGFWLGEGGVNALFNIGDASEFFKWTGSGIYISGSITGTLSADLNMGSHAFTNCGDFRGTGWDAGHPMYVLNPSSAEWIGYSATPWGAANSSYVYLAQNASIRGHTDLTCDAQAGDLYLYAADDVIISPTGDIDFVASDGGAAGGLTIAPKSMIIKFNGAAGRIAVYNP